MKWVSCYNFCAFDLLGRDKNLMGTNYEEQNPKDTPKQEEVSSVLQQCKVLVDVQIELFGHLERAFYIHDFDSRLVKSGLATGGPQSL